MSVVWHLNMTLVKVKQELFEIAILILHNFLTFITAIKSCLEA